MTQPVELTVSLKLKAPFLFPGQDPGKFGYDRVALRGRDGAPLIPQDQVKGLIRHGLLEMGESELVTALMGQSAADARGDDAGNFDPAKGQMFCSDLRTAKPDDGDHFDYHRVKIDTESGASEQGHLLRIEQVFAPESPVLFSGTITLFPPNLEPVPDAAALATLLEAALECKRAIGAMASIGFGRIVSCSVQAKRDRETIAKCNVPADPVGRFIWRFNVDRSYLVNARRTNNGYTGQPEIPGGALKGLLARNAELRGEPLDPIALSTAVFSHGAQDRRSPIPASVVHVPTSIQEPFLNLAGGGKYPLGALLQIDWKNTIEDAYWAHIGMKPKAEVEYEERVHTEINIQTGAAKDERLFSTISVVPRDGAFEAIIDTTGLRRDSARSILEALSLPLYGLGRTDAQLTPIDFAPAAEISPIKEGRYALMLTTPAFLQTDDLALRVDAIKAYASTFAQFLPASSLVEVFATQVLIGDYLARRYSPGEKYRPWILTRPGSVFVIDIAGSDIARLESLQRAGLASTTRDGVELDWRNCPFVAQNGYGAFTLEPIRGAA